jgi:hypothetical protein
MQSTSYRAGAATFRPATSFDPVVLNAKLPLEFFETRNAVRIAQSEGAEQYGRDSYQHAVQLMNNTDEYATRNNAQKKPLIAVARETVQTAEDAPAIAVTKMDDQRLASERQASMDTQAQGKPKPTMRTGRRSKPSLMQRKRNRTPPQIRQYPQQRLPPLRPMPTGLA